MRFYELSEKLTKIFAAGALVLLTSACAPSAFDANDGSRAGSTGYFSPSGAPYTIGGDLRVEEARTQIAPKDPSQPTVIEQARLDLAHSVRGLTIRRFAGGERVQLGGDSVVAKLELDGPGPSGKRELIFYGKLDGAGAGHLRSIEFVATSATEYSVSFEIEDAADKKVSLGRVTLRRYDSAEGSKSRKLLAQVPIFWRAFAAKVDLHQDADQTIERGNETVVEILNKESFAWAHNIVVPQGRSFYSIELVTTKAGENTPIAKADLSTRAMTLFSMGGEAVRTGEDSSPAQVTSGSIKIMSAELIGDAETTDDRTFAIAVQALSGQVLNMALHIEGAPSVQPAYDPRLKGVTPKAYFALTTNELKVPRMKKVIDDFEANYNLPSVQQWIKTYSQGPRRDSLINALNNALAFRPIVSAVFTYKEVPAPASLLTLIESSYFAGGQYKIETNPISTATGPFQILYGTGEALGMRVASNKPGRLPPAIDERRYFVPSACGAAKHLRTSIDYFMRGDATVAFLAYNIGDTAAASTIHCMVKKGDCRRTSAGVSPQKRINALETVSRYNFSYREISKQKMVSKQYLEYVDRALALYFVTGNPEKYGIQWNSPSSVSQPPRSALLPPNPIKDTDCRAAVQSVLSSAPIRPKL